MASTGSPLLDQYNQDGIVTPGIQRAMQIFKQNNIQQVAPLGQPAQSAPLVNPNPRPLGMQPESPAPPLGQAPNPTLAGHQAELARITAPPLQGPQAHTPANTGVSGIDQIHNAWLRTPLKILDAIGAGFFPGLEMAVPGTQGHHNVLARQAAGNVANDEKAATEEAQRGLTVM